MIKYVLRALLITVSFVAIFNPLTTFALDSKYLGLKQNIESKMPEVKIDSIQPYLIPGLLEVSSGPEIFYVSDDGKYMIYGDVIALNQDKSNWGLTEESRRKARARLINDLSKDDMIIYEPKGEAKAHVTIFTDLDCAYCKKLHNNISELNKLGIEIRYVAFPRSGPDTDSFTKAISVWCAKDKNKMFSEAIQGKDVPKATCNDPVMNQFDLGIKMRIDGTPTLVFADGSMISGYLSPEKLAKLAIEHANSK